MSTTLLAAFGVVVAGRSLLMAQQRAAEQARSLDAPIAVRKDGYLVAVICPGGRVYRFSQIPTRCPCCESNLEEGAE